MKKSKGNAERVPATLLEALRAQFPDTWRHEIAKMRAEHKAKLENK
jgi:hypothetical protein